MAGDWIKMRVDLRDDPAVFKIAEILGIDELHVVGSLFCFWAWADKHAVDGHVDGATSRLVDKVSMTPGFADALGKVGWLLIDESGITIPNFERHNGESAKERGLKNARQARWRANRGGDVDGQSSTSASTTASTREEKRREEVTEPEGSVERASKRAIVIRPVDVPDAVWSGFLAIRKAKRAPLSQAALDGIEREAAKAGMTLADTLALCCTRGWQGFKAEWVQDRQQSQQRTTSRADLIAGAAAAIFEDATHV